MRWLVGILLLANLVIFLWGYNRTPTPQITKGPAPNIPTLRLLREVEPQAPETLLAQAGEPGASTQAATAPAQAPRLERLAATTPIAAPVAAEPPPAKITRDDRPTVVEGPAAQPSPPSAAETKPHAAEPAAVTPTAPDESLAAVILPPTKPEPEPAVLQCGRLGPFASQAAAEKAKTALKALGAEVRLSEASQRLPAGYWVLIPPLPDRSEAKVVAAKLKAAGITDIWLLVKGSMRNAISLGQFSSEANAQRRAAAVKAAGFNAEVRQKSKRVKRFWLDYAAPADFTLPPSLGSSPDQITAEKQPCP